jgi:hypothetical protein
MQHDRTLPDAFDTLALPGYVAPGSMSESDRVPSLSTQR